jgi:hypothetical protein
MVLRIFVVEKLAFRFKDFGVQKLVGAEIPLCGIAFILGTLGEITSRSDTRE